MYRLLLVATLLMCGCDRHAEGAVAGVDIARAAQEAQGTVNAYADNVMASAESDGPPAPMPETPGGPADDPAPVSEATFAADSAQGAANVVQTYYALIGEGRYAQARALWEPAAAGAGTSDVAFARQFARYASYRAQVGAPGEIDAGAGQRYVTVPVRITARLIGGGQASSETVAVTLHRTGDIDGASAAQRSWHLRSIASAPPAAVTR